MPPHNSSPKVDYASFDVGNELYEFLADCRRSTRERAAGPENKAILGTGISVEFGPELGERPAWRKRFVAQ